MIGLAIMSLIAMILASGMGSGLRVLGRNGQVAGQVDEALARHELRRWLEFALVASPGVNLPHGFEGKPDGFRFIAQPTDGRFWAGTPAVIRVTGEPSAPVVAKIEAQAPAPPHSPSGEKLILAPSAKSLSIRYFGSIAPNTPPNWHTSWPEDRGLPELVSLSFGPDAPPLTVRPAKALTQREMSLSSLLPPALPSRP